MNLYLIDGNSYVYRAYYAIRELSTSQGFSTNAIYGFTTMLLKIIRNKKPDSLAVFFDSAVPTERHMLFEEYKAHRPETPDYLISQYPHIRRILEALHISIFEMPGYEADDIIGTIARKGAAQGIEVLIVTADKDMLQLVNELVKVYDPVKDRILDSGYVMEKFGVGPERVPEFMALAGDAVDNIPGVKGIGEKTAKELLQTFSSIDDLLEHPDRIQKERVRALIEGNREIVRLSHQLSAINTSVPVDFDPAMTLMKDPDWQALAAIFKELEFTSMLKIVPYAAPECGKHESVMTMERLGEIISSCHNECALSIEATAGGRDIDGIALCAGKGTGCYIPLCSGSIALPLLPATDVLKVLAPLMENPQISKTGHNLKQDMIILRQHGVILRGMLYDTMIASYLLNPNKTDHTLEEISLVYLSRRKKGRSEVLQKKQSFSDLTVEEAAGYAAGNAAAACELKDILFEKLREEEIEDLYMQIEMPLIPVLACMEMAGVKIDVALLGGISKELERELDAIQRRIYFLAGEEFNINSPKQLSRVLFDSLGMKPGRKTKTGFSTEVGVLEELALTYDLPREILNWRSLNKLKTTYVDVLPVLIRPETGRLHTSFNQAATATGRLSSSEPNLQNIPVRGEWGRRIRETFIAEEGLFLLSADYSQVELRILAHLSNDEVLIDAFLKDIDIHSGTASAIFGTPLEMVTPDMRRIAKMVNFGVIYGMSPFGLSAALGIPREEARVYIEQYFVKYAGVKEYIERTIECVRKDGYVRTLFGRKRLIPELASRNNSVRQQGERLAINSPIQGTAADIIKIAMIRINKALSEPGLIAKMTLQVHDELLFELPLHELETVREIVKREMEGVVSLSVPLKVDIRSGRNWAEAH
jgi:DNA polymerase-1